MFNSLKQSSIAKALLLSFAIVSITGISFIVLKSKFNVLLNKNKAYLVKIDQERLTLFEENKNPSIKPSEKDILRSKIQTLQEQRDQHMSLMSMIYQDYYALLTMFPFLSGLTGLFAFILLQNGLANSSIYTKTCFAILALLSAVTGVFPDVYQQEENIDNYSYQYTHYTILQKEIFNYNLTAPYLNKDSIDFNDYIIQLNQREIELINFHLRLKKKEVSKETFEIN